jgi:type VI secretion system secreted protein VgrG
VQYRETSLNFISRLMEEQGIYYFFTHVQGTHTMVLADGPSAHQSVATLYYKVSPNHLGTDTITDLSVEQAARASGYTTLDYDFTAPTKNLLASTDAPLADAVAGMELMDYPGGYDAPDAGTALTKVRLEEVQAAHKIARGQTEFRGLYAGAIFTLSDHPVAAYNVDWLVTSVSLNAAIDDYATGGGNGGAGGNAHFTCSFTAIPAQTTYRPPRITPQPMVCGPQPALVVGTAGEEIYTDQYGRIKVQFYWDRLGTKDQNSSMFVRVSQSLAGKNFGSIFLPRIGHEVLVEFTDGDPDRPIVTGSVYNGDNLPPYTLPDNQTQSGIKTNSSKGGGGSNELRFEDKAGNEQVYLHAQKDFQTQVENDCAETIGHDHTIEVDNDQTEHVKHDRTETVDNDHTETIKNNRNLTVSAKETIEVDGDHSETVKGDVSQTYQGNHTEQTTKDYSLKAENITLEANTKLTLKMGNSTIVIDSSGVKITTDQTLDGEAQQQVTFKGQTGVQIQSSANLDIKAQAQLGLEGTAQAELKGAVAKVTGQGQAALTAAGQVQVQGAVVMIN